MNKDKLRVWHFSDTHTMEHTLQIPDNIDVALFSGDCSNPQDPIRNKIEVENFIAWFKSIPIKHKVACVGNHDISVERNYVTPADFAAAGITLLKNNSTTIEGLKIWGSPISPSFGTGWAYNMSRDKIDRLWSTIPEDTDIVLTHGPCKGILDLSFNREGELEQCGCTALRRHILFRVKPKLFCSGHIHNMEGILNQGIMKVAGFDTIFSNGSVVMDGRFDKGAINNGNIIEL